MHRIFFLFLGLAILASLIHDATLGGLDPRDFRQLTPSARAVLPYYAKVPQLRPCLLSNTATVFAMTALVLALPLGLVAMLVGLTVTVICYVLLDLRYRHLVRSAHVSRSCAARHLQQASGRGRL